MATPQSLPAQSALSNLLSSASAKLPTDALPLEIFHNLQYQHSWRDLRICSLANSSPDTILTLEVSRLTPTSHPSPRPPPIKLVTGTPPRPSYIHPDFQAHLLKHRLSVDDVPIQREWVLPLNTGEKWSLARLSDIFDSLPKRELLIGASGYKHQDAKRVLLGMISHNGGGGDGTVVYYIMQEGDVKPRQN